MAAARRPCGDCMAKLDTNKDGRISREEAKADPRLAARFDQMDVNKDGYLDKADRELGRSSTAMRGSPRPTPTRTAS